MADFDLCALPALQPPDGEASDLVSPYSLTPTMIAVSTILLVWAVPFVSIRIWMNRRKLGVGDVFVMICATWDVVFTAIILTQARYGRHQWNIPACWFDGQYVKTSFLAAALFGFISFGRAAILLMYRQIFSIISRTMQIAIWIGLVFNFIIYLPSIPIAAYYEAPHSNETWEQVLYRAQDVKNFVLPYGIAAGAAAVLVDVYIFVLPLPLVLRLNLSQSKKLQAIAVFATALLAVVASIIALIYRAKLIDKTDNTWSTSCLFISLIVENNIVLIVASIPAFTAFFRQNIAESSLYKTLQSRLVGLGNKARSHGRPRPMVSGSTERLAFPMPVLRTIGGSVQPLDFYHKLDNPSRTTIRSYGPRSNFCLSSGDAVKAMATDVGLRSEPRGHGWMV